jgi:hypothetical protein
MKKLADCSVVVRRLRMLPIESIVRGYLSGSAWASYQKDGTVCGIKLRDGLQESQKLDHPIWTPSTKAPAGEHDINIGPEQGNPSFPLHNCIKANTRSGGNLRRRDRCTGGAAIAPNLPSGFRLCPLKGHHHRRCNYSVSSVPSILVFMSLHVRPNNALSTCFQCVCFLH